MLQSIIFSDNSITSLIQVNNEYFERRIEMSGYAILGRMFFELGLLLYNSLLLPSQCEYFHCKSRPYIHIYVVCKFYEYDIC